MIFGMSGDRWLNQERRRKLKKAKDRMRRLASHSQTMTDMVMRRGLEPEDAAIVMVMSYKTLLVLYGDELRPEMVRRYARLVEELGISKELAGELLAFEEQPDDETRDHQTDDRIGSGDNSP